MNIRQSPIEQSAVGHRDDPAGPGSPEPTWREFIVELIGHRWPQAAARLGRLPAWLGIAVAAAGGAAAVLVVFSVLAVAVHGVVDLGSWAADTGVIHTVTDPISTYLHHHTAGLPVGGGTLTHAWYWVGGVVLVLAVLGAIGARIGWALYGAASAAMVYAQAPHPSRWVAVGILGVVWVALSVAAYRRPWTTTPDPVVIVCRGDHGPASAAVDGLGE